MELFNRFRDTVFLKEDSDLVKELEELKKIRESIKNKDEIDRDIRILEYGIIGEKEIAFELKNAHIGMYVLHDVTFEYNGNKAQIDYIIFSRGNYYIVECKNLFGNITVDNNGQFFRDFEYNGKKIKETIYSPYTQIMRHRDILEKVWSANHGKIMNMLFGNSDNFFKPLVVLANSKSMLNTKYAPPEIKKCVIRADQLIDYIKKDIEKMDNDMLDNEKQLKKAAELWLSRSVKNDTNIVDRYSDKKIDLKVLEEKLRNFRRDRSFTKNIPAYYVFTDNELKMLLKYLPTTIDELKSLGILTDIKIQCHGKEIVNIINDMG